MRNIVLLTSTIAPKQDQPQLKVFDPTERLSEYMRSLEYYVGLVEKGVISNVVYIDNSGYDLSEIKDKYESDNVEIISFRGLEYPKHYHRGYGEFKLIEYAMNNSSTIKSSEENDRVWKITGRYIVANLEKFIRFSPNEFGMYCDINGTWIEMSIMAWSVKGYTGIKKIYKQFEGPAAPEPIMAEYIKELGAKRNNIVSSYYWAPLIIGRRGYDGSPYIGKFTIIKHVMVQVENFIKLPFRKRNLESSVDDSI